MAFAIPGWLILLVLVPALLIVAVIASRSRRQAWRLLVAARLRHALMRGASPLPRWLALAALLAAFTCLVAALARPQGEAGTRTEAVRGRNVIIAMDLSRSMLVTDVSPNRLDQARNDFDSAILIDPDYARAYHMRGLVNEKQGDDQTALSDFSKAIDLNPEYGAAYYSRASLHTKLSDTEKAQADAEMVAHLGSKNMESYMSDNNVWHTQHMRVEDALETELER